MRRASITIALPPYTLEKFKKYLAKKYGYIKKGTVGEEVAKALEYWMNAGPENIEINETKEDFEDENFKALLNEIRELRNEIASLKIVQFGTNKINETIEKTKVMHNSNFELPSFLKDNPWVEILSSKKYYENG
jgi:hypothetical protein